MMQSIIRCLYKFDLFSQMWHEWDHELGGVQLASSNTTCIYHLAIVT